jgi:hypothetical protein
VTFSGNITDDSFNGLYKPVEFTITTTPNTLEQPFTGGLVDLSANIDKILIWLSKEERELIEQYRKDGKSIRITQETTITVEEPKQGRKFKEIT